MESGNSRRASSSSYHHKYCYGIAGLDMAWGVFFCGAGGVLLYVASLIRAPVASVLQVYLPWGCGMMKRHLDLIGPN